jgi:serine acetyltransferase
VRVGDDVLIGDGALVVGPLAIGDGATVPPGAVLVADVPSGAVGAGVFARSAC